MTDDNGAVRVAEDNLRSHIYQLVHKEQTAFEHFLMNEYTTFCLGGNHQQHTEHCVYLIQWNDAACTILFFGIALLMGIGFGIMFPAFNTLFVNLAPNNQRGTATSTYLTSWDVGIGIGMLTGGYIAEICSFDKAYLFGACLTVVSAVYFKLKVTPHYHKNKLR